MLSQALEQSRKETVDKLLSQHKNFVVKAPLNVYQKYKEVYANGYDEVEIEAFAIGGRQPYTYEWQISLVDENDFNTITESNGMNLWGIDEPVLTIPAVNYLHYTLEWRCLVTPERILANEGDLVMNDDAC